MRNRAVNLLPMAIRCFIFTLLAMLGTGLYGQSTFDHDMEAIIKGEREAFVAKTKPKSKRSGNRYDLTYQKLTLDIDSLAPRNRRIEGNVYSELIALDDNFTSFTFDLTGNMVVDSVKVNGVITSFVRAGNEIVLNVAAQNAGVVITSQVYYSGDPSKSDQRGFNYDAQLAGPMIWTLSQPYGAYGWWPCKQQLADKIDSFDMDVRIPKGNKAAGLGILAAVDTLAEGSLVFKWRHRHPVSTYLVSVTVTNYYEESHYIQLSRGDSVLQLDYIYPAYKPAADTLRWAIDGMMRTFDSLFGDYPFKDEKHGHAMFGRGGGMEHQTMSSMAHLRFDLMAHELGHQWFGDKITCGSWQDLWLNEGWATYANAIAREFHKTKEEHHTFLQSSINSATKSNGGAVYAYDTSDVRSLFDGDIRYNKGSAVLNQLRWEVGDSAFFAGTRNYMADADLCYGFAYTQDFQEAIEAASGQDLNPFFDRYVYKEGFPILTTRWNRVNAGDLRIKIDQVTSHPSVSFFPLKIPFRAMGPNGDTTFLLNHLEPNQELTFDLGFRVDELLFDPDYWLLARNTLVEGTHVDLSSIQVFPNPSANSLSVFMQDKKVDRLELVDLQGRVLQALDVQSLKGKTTTIDISSLVNGIYLLRAMSGGESIVVKFTKTSF